MLGYEYSYIFAVFHFCVMKRLTAQEICCEEERIRKYFENFKENIPYSSFFLRAKLQCT